MGQGAKWRAVALVMAAANLAAAIPAKAQEFDEHALSSVGAPELEGLMNALFAAFARANPDMRKGEAWDYRSADLAIGALMYQQADIAPMVRAFERNEIAPYDHQFRGDMMKAPAMVQIATRDGSPVWLAFNRRPGAPHAEDVRRFVEFVLGPEGQAVLASTSRFGPLPAGVADEERRKIASFVATLDPAIESYRASKGVVGEVSSIGSDGMKSLMDRWMDEFEKRQPGVRRGERWEHPGTLNGFYALTAGLVDLAPMGRELWPQEASTFAQATGLANPLEIRVARGGFNTPQRTTAQVIFVHEGNPVRAVSLPQLRAILSEHPTITRWGELGATGVWADRPIRIYMPPAASPNAMSLQMSVLRGQRWNAAAREGSISDTAKALAADLEGLGFGGMEEGGPGLQALRIAPSNGAEAIAPTYESVSSGQYPLTRFMYIRLARQPGVPMLPHVREFLRYVLSREGQHAIIASGYFPLTERELRQERAKLD